MRTLLFFVISSGMLMLSSCDMWPGHPLHIRIRNISEFKMYRIRVFFPDGEMDYGSLEPGQSNGCQEPAKAYRYASSQAIIRDKKAASILIDYVGEEYLDEGNYTYAISIIDSTEPVTEGNGYYNLGVELE